MTIKEIEAKLRAEGDAYKTPLGGAVVNLVLEMAHWKGMTDRIGTAVLSMEQPIKAISDAMREKTSGAGRGGYYMSDAEAENIVCMTLKLETETNAKKTTTESASAPIDFLSLL